MLQTHYPPTWRHVVSVEVPTQHVKQHQITRGCCRFSELCGPLEDLSQLTANHRLIT